MKNLSVCVRPSCFIESLQTMRLGDAHTMVNAPDWRAVIDDDSLMINEATLRKLMRGQVIKNKQQYRLQFDSVHALRQCLTDNDGWPVVEETPIVAFTLGLDWLSSALRALMDWHVAVVLVVDAQPLTVCKFRVS